MKPLLIVALFTVLIKNSVFDKIDGDCINACADLPFFENVRCNGRLLDPLKPDYTDERGCHHWGNK